MWPKRDLGAGDLFASGVTQATAHEEWLLAGVSMRLSSCVQHRLQTVPVLVEDPALSRKCALTREVDRTVNLNVRLRLLESYCSRVSLLRQLIYDHDCRVDRCIYRRDRMNPSGFDRMRSIRTRHINHSCYLSVSHISV
jgi:hypothetical protein